MVTIGSENVLLFLIIGIVAGWLAGKVGKGSGVGLIGDIIVGLLGAFVGFILMSLLGMHIYGIGGTIVIAVVGAVVLLVVIRAF